jgi:hypothetical protein
MESVDVVAGLERERFPHCKEWAPSVYAPCSDFYYRDVRLMRVLGCLCNCSSIQDENRLLRYLGHKHYMYL